MINILVYLYSISGVLLSIQTLPSLENIILPHMH